MNFRRIMHEADECYLSTTLIRDKTIYIMKDESIFYEFVSKLAEAYPNIMWVGDTNLSRKLSIGETNFIHKCKKVCIRLENTVISFGKLDIYRMWYPKYKFIHVNTNFRI